MNGKTILIIIAVIIVLLAGGAAAFFFFNPSELSAPQVVTPTVAPVVQPQVQPEISISAPATGLAAGTPTSLDVFLDTKGVKIDGFQFIATLEGSANPTVTDTNDVVEGGQINAESIPELTVTTNSVVEQDGSKVVRFAMITQSGIESYQNTSPVKIASIPLSLAQTGTISFTFNTQNSRASIAGGGQDALLAVKDETFTVRGELTSTSSETALAIASSSATPVALATTPKTYPTCQLSCVTDNDCDAGLICNAGICANAACTSSTSCVCGSSVASTTSTTSTSSALIAQAVPTATPTPLPLTTTMIAATTDPLSEAASESSTASTESLPVAGTVEYTLFLAVAGLFLLGLGLVVSDPA